MIRFNSDELVLVHRALTYMYKMAMSEEELKEALDNDAKKYKPMLKHREKELGKIKNLIYKIRAN